MESSWVEIASKFGIPVGLLVLIGYIFVKYIWPFYTKQVEQGNADRRADLEAARQDRKEEVTKFLEHMRARDILIAEISERNFKAMDAITSEVRGLRDEFKHRK